MVVRAELTVRDWLLVPAADERVIVFSEVVLTEVADETAEQLGAFETTTV
jgi:hypothetical protein